MQKGALNLRESIAHLAYPPAPFSTPLRRSSRTSVIAVKVEVKEEPGLLSPSLQKSTRKRKLLKTESEEESLSPKRRPTKRGYADPETYAHLEPLSDHLALYLDVVFCGINPGQKSALDGHHFANPTNHFWRCLHSAGFTKTLLPPAEDATLPILYNIGLTNLVERPSAEQAELSKEEMKQSVPALKAKITAYRPNIVCFVGKGIWLIVEGVLKGEIRDRLGAATIAPPSTPQKPTAKRPGKRKVGTSFDWGLQPYKIVYPDEEIKSEDAVTSITGEPGSGASQNIVVPPSETLFFVMPSTSGRVVSHQLEDKKKLFAHLYGDLQKVKSGTLDTSNMVSIPL